IDRVGRGFALTELSDANRQSDRTESFAGRFLDDLLGFDGLADLLGDAARIGERRVGKDHDKLFAAKAGGRVAAFDVRLEALRDEAKNLVAGGVAPGIV